MDLKTVVLLLSTFMVYAWCLPTNPNVAGPMWGAVGCFKDHRKSRKNEDLRALRKLYYNIRPNIPWNDLSQVPRKCGDEALLKNFDYFGIQFWGECWSDKDAATRYDKYGASANCNDDLGIGKDFTNYVYRKHCGSPQFGCCPDGETGATGPNGEGCDNGEVCANPDLDIVFIIDDSASLSKTDFNTEKTFVKDVIDALSNLTLQVGLVKFGALTSTIFDLNDHSSMTSVKSKIDGVSFGSQMGTYIGYALNAANNIFTGSGGMRENSGKVLVLVTDGKDNNLDSVSSGYLNDMPTIMENKGIHIITVGVGNGIDVNQLKEIATAEDSYYQINDYDDLADKVDEIANNACKN